VFDTATSACRGVHTLTAELQISGRVGRQKLRGRAIVGAAEPAALRLEGVAPFGAPAFILVAREGRGTLLLPRDRRVLRDAAPEQILDALTGVSMTPDALRALLAGCFAADVPPSNGEKYGDRWAVLTFDPAGGEAYLRRDADVWHLVSAKKGTVTVDYEAFAGTRPQRVRIRIVPQGQTRPATDLTIELSQVELNTTLDRDAFAVQVPADAAPVTLDELRAAGPLGAPGR
jgi:hypothetical protein